MVEKTKKEDTKTTVLQEGKERDFSLISGRHGVTLTASKDNTKHICRKHKKKWGNLSVFFSSKIPDSLIRWRNYVQKLIITYCCNLPAAFTPLVLLLLGTNLRTLQNLFLLAVSDKKTLETSSTRCCIIIIHQISLSLSSVAASIKRTSKQISNHVKTKNPS